MVLGSSGHIPAVVEPLPKQRPKTLETQDPAPALYIYQDVLEEVRFNGGWRPDRTAGGLLVGAHYRDPADGAAFVEAEGFVAGAHIGDVHEFTQYLRVQWKSATAALRYHFPEAEIIGWYLATPNGAAPGQAALVLHNTFFNHPWQTGLWVAGDEPPRTVRPLGDGLAEGPVGVLTPR